MATLMGSERIRTIVWVAVRSGLFVGLGMLSAMVSRARAHG